MLFWSPKQGQWGGVSLKGASLRMSFLYTSSSQGEILDQKQQHHLGIC